MTIERLKLTWKILKEQWRKKKIKKLKNTLNDFVKKEQIDRAQLTTLKARVIDLETRISFLETEI